MRAYIVPPVASDTTKKKRVPPKREAPPAPDSFREKPADKPKVRRAPVDTVALKDQIAKGDKDYDDAIRSSVRLERFGHKDLADNEFTRALTTGTSNVMNRARLDSARAGQLPAKALAEAFEKDDKKKKRP